MSSRGEHPVYAVRVCGEMFTRAYLTTYAYHIQRAGRPAPRPARTGPRQPPPQDRAPLLAPCDPPTRPPRARCNRPDPTPLLYLELLQLP